MRLSDWIKQQGILKKVFAERVGVSAGMISLLISGQRSPGLELALRIQKETKNRVKVSDWEKPPKHESMQIAAE